MIPYTKNWKLLNIAGSLIFCQLEIRERYSKLFSNKYSDYVLADVMSNIILVNELIPQSWVHNKSRMAQTANGKQYFDADTIAREITSRTLSLFQSYKISIKGTIERPDKYYIPYVFSAYDYCCNPVTNTDIYLQLSRNLYSKFSKNEKHLQRFVTKCDPFHLRKLYKSKSFTEGSIKYDPFSQLCYFLSYGLKMKTIRNIEEQVEAYMTSNTFHHVNKFLNELRVKYQFQDSMSFIYVEIDQEWQVKLENSYNLELKTELNTEGFEGISFGDSLTCMEEDFSKIEHFEETRAIHGLLGFPEQTYKVLRRRDGTKMIGNAEAEHIIYFFYEDKFIGIQSKFFLSECKNILQTLKVYFGEPGKDESTNGWIHYQWNDKEGTAYCDFSTKYGLAYFFILHSNHSDLHDQLIHHNCRSR